jgi:hypothetical protein
MTSTDCIRVTTVVRVDARTAFEIFTEEIDSWWQKGPRYRVHPDRDGVMRFEPGVGGRLLELYDDGDAFEHGRVRVWQPAARIVFEMSGRDFAPGESTEVEVAFHAVDGGTRVSVEHRGWDRFAQDHPVRHGLVGGAFTSLMGVWWGDLLVALGSHAHRDRVSESHPHG